MEASLNGPNGRVVLTAIPLTIGRTPDNQVVVTDLKASSHHAEVRLADNGNRYSVVDRGSTNGTFVNEQQLERNVPRILSAGDIIRIGDTRFTYEASGAGQADPTVYANQGNQPGYTPTVAVPPPNPATAYGNQEHRPAYDPTVAAPPPAPGRDYGNQPNYPYQQTPPPQPSYPAYQPAALPGYGQPPYSYPPAAPVPPRVPNKSNRTLFIILGSVIGVLLLLCILFTAISLVTRSTPQKTLTTYCNALKSGDYQTAYNQYSSAVRDRTSVTALATLFSRSGLTDCSVSNASENGTVGSGSITYVLNTRNGKGTITDDFTLIKEDNEWKISEERTRS